MKNKVDVKAIIEQYEDALYKCDTEEEFREVVELYANHREIFKDITLAHTIYVMLHDFAEHYDYEF